MSESKELSTAQKLVGDFAPKLAQLTDDVLFADVWARPGLSRQGRAHQEAGKVAERSW